MSSGLGCVGTRRGGCGGSGEGPGTLQAGGEEAAEAVMESSFCFDHLKMSCVEQFVSVDHINSVTMEVARRFPGTHMDNPLVNVTIVVWRSFTVLHVTLMTCGGK